MSNVKHVIGRDRETGIPFTQYLRPDGCKRAVVVDRPQEIASLARKVIAAGGRFECEVLSDGVISLTCSADVDDGPEDIAIELCFNAATVNDNIDALVRSAAAYFQCGGTRKHKKRRQR